MQAGVSLLVSDVMPIYMIIPRYSHNYAQFCQLLNNNLFTHCMLFFSREATSEIYGPGVTSLSYFQIYKTKNPKIPCCNLFYLAFDLSIFTTFPRPRAISRAVTRKGLTTPLTRRVARCCYLCAGAIYVVLLGSPTGSITLVLKN